MDRMEEQKILTDFVKSNYFPLSNLDKRFHKENPNSRARNEYQRDYSRILYSPSFRRLQGKMQLLGVQNDKFYRNRLTHSLEVSQIARGIAGRLREITGIENLYVDDIYVIEAGALAHDIGNPPFGHHGERVLNELSKDFGGFEGNAQSLRVLTELEKKLPNNKGLNLTFRTLLSIVKYFVPFRDGKKKFIYNEQYDFLLEKLAEFDSILPRTLDVQIVDLADEIAYAAHDLEDALSLKLFTIDEFMFEFQHFMDKSEDFRFAYKKLEEIVQQAKKVARSASNYNSSEEFGLLLRKEITSNIVDILIKDIGVVNVDEKHIDKTGTKHKEELGFKTLGKLASGLKDFTFKSINRSNQVQLYEKQGEKIIKGLYDAYLDREFNKNGLLLPVEFRSEDEQIQKRYVIDYISGMMDSFAIKTYVDLFGSSSLDKIYDKKYFGGYKTSLY